MEERSEMTRRKKEKHKERKKERSEMSGRKKVRMKEGK